MSEKEKRAYFENLRQEKAGEITSEIPIPLGPFLLGWVGERKPALKSAMRFAIGLWARSPCSWKRGPNLSPAPRSVPLRLWQEQEITTKVLHCVFPSGSFGQGLHTPGNGDLTYSINPFSVLVL